MFLYILQVFNIENIFVKGISLIRKINKVIVSSRERSSAHFRKKKLRNLKNIDFSISRI